MSCHCYKQVQNSGSVNIGFIQGSLSKYQGPLKDFSSLFYSFQGLKV